jgi:glycosyltransferase involved in cell wall biosynthesis
MFTVCAELAARDTITCLMHSSLSVFFPAYNDAPSLPNLIGKAFAILAQHVEDYEVIVVNDGSFDDTGAVLAELGRRYGPRMRVITHSENRGYGGALRSGFQAATKEWVFYTDGDGQYDVAEMPRLLAEIRPGVGLVNGFKLERHDPLHRIWIGRVYNSFARTLFRIRLSDIDCDYRLVRRDLLKDADLTSTSGTVCVELVRKLELTACGVVEVGVHHYPRLYGRSQFFRVRSLATTLQQLIRLHFRIVMVPVLSDCARFLRLGAWVSGAAAESKTPE